MLVNLSCADFMSGLSLSTYSLNFVIAQKHFHYCSFYLISLAFDYAAGFGYVSFSFSMVFVRYVSIFTILCMKKCWTHVMNMSTYRSSNPEVLCKKAVLEVSQNSQKNKCARVSFLIKLQARGLQLYLKRDSGTGVFLWILRNFQEHLFL